MNRFEKFGVVTFVVVAGVILLRHAGTAIHASVPKDMPQTASFVQSGYDLSRNEAQGNWIACQENSASAADYCRVTDQKGIVVFQGDFLPIGTAREVPTSHLKVDVADANKMWVQGPAERGPVPVITLADGQVLVPVADQTALKQRWAGDPSEFRRVTGETD
jgi:hypothetical protein